MSENIYAFVEVEYPRVGFQNMARIYFSRDYTLFSLLAGIHKDTGYIAPIVEPRGLPENISMPVKFARAGKFSGQVIGESWMTFGELQIVQRTYKERRGKENIELKAVIAMMEVFNNCSLIGPRLVFWFDRC